MSIRVGTPAELSVPSENVAAFFRREWARPISLGDNRFYNWQFVQPPFQNQKDSCCIVIDESNEILGVMGVNDRHFMLNNERKYGAELTTWIIQEKYRNKGYAVKIISYLQEKYEILLGMGISGDAMPVYLRNGFHFLSAIPRFVKVLDWSRVDEYADYTPLAKKVDKYWSNKNFTNNYISKSIEESTVERICNAFYSQHNMFSRDFQYLKWRYLEHPDFTYNLSIVHSEETTEGCLLATRVEQVTDDLSILHIMDILGDSRDIPAAIACALDYARENDIPVIDFFCTDSFINSFLVDRGWFSTLDNHFFRFPHLFQPVELRNPATTSMIYWSNKSEIELCDLGRLYVTKQDADFDRPVLKQ